MILAVSHPADDHAAAVLRALARRGHRAVLFDTARFPSRASLTLRFEASPPRYECALDGDHVDFAACGVAWWRRPLPFTLHDGLAAASVPFTYSECHEAVAGLWSALDIRWVNPPDRDEIAHHKPYQLAVAGRLGLPIPRTVVTNDPDAARRFIDELGPANTIYKTFLATDQCWRETRVVRPEELDILDSVRLAPVIFQEFVPAVADVRVTVVGPRLFAAAITAAPGGYQVDYRMDIGGARFEPIELPPGTCRQIQALMGRLGLVYGALDFRRTPEGRFVFLEVNPAGEWGFVEERTGQPITEAMADLLIELDQPPC